MYHIGMNEKILSVKEFAGKIKVTRLTVMRMIKAGKILAFRLSDAQKSPYRIKESEVDRLISFELHKKMLKEQK